MSLFICENCGCIENHMSMKPKDKNRLNPNYPNMYLMEMHGAGYTDTYVNNDIFKYKNDVLMLCSKCNTGAWHDEFERVQATEIEKEIAKYSEFNYITPSDHPDGCIAGEYDDYHVDNRFKLFVDIFGKYAYSRDKNGDYSNILYKIYTEDIMNFDIACLYTLQNELNDIGISLNDHSDEALSHTDDNTNYIKTAIQIAIRSSQIYSHRSKSKTFIRYMGYTGGVSIGMSPYEFKNNSLALHWKDTQSENDKIKMLKLAELKREIKRLKKHRNDYTINDDGQKVSNIVLLKEVQLKYNALK